MKVSLALQHYLNPLNIYCRLCDLGISRKRAFKIAQFYEKWTISIMIGFISIAGLLGVCGTYWICWVR